MPAKPKSTKGDDAKKLASRGCLESSCSLSSFIGFAATKDFRSARRAMRPQVGDTFVTRRDGILMFSQVDWISKRWIGIGRFMAESGHPIGFFRMSKRDWNAACIAVLRRGCEFRPANGEHVHH
jgi:hypothetical protein